MTKGWSDRQYCDYLCTHNNNSLQVDISRLKHKMGHLSMMGVNIKNILSNTFTSVNKINLLKNVLCKSIHDKLLDASNF